jgi:hypothetical protein
VQIRIKVLPEIELVAFGLASQAGLRLKLGLSLAWFMLGLI